jgi:hypothetical protein
VQGTRGFRPGGRSPDGAFVLPPTYFVSITWRNTATPGVFLTVERNDEIIRRNPDPNSPVQWFRQSFWNEVERLPTGTDPTSATVYEPDQFNLSAGNTYRVCAVVPALGDAGKVCSEPVSLP